MAEKQAEAPEAAIKVIGVEDDIPDPDEKKVDKFLTLQEQLHPVELELLKPMEVSDRTEPMTTIRVVAPTSKQISDAEGNIGLLSAQCVQGIKPNDLDLHGRDYIRLHTLIRHFLR